MSSRSPRQAFAQLQRLARNERRGNTQQVLELFVHERFLARLAVSRYAERLILKGGMLLAVLEVRRATRDADMLAMGISNSEETVRSVVREIAEIPMDDGAVFDASGVTTEAIREEADYRGVRASMPATVGGARLKLVIDISFGDPVDPQKIEYPTLLNDPPFDLLGYPVETVIAEKVETMMARGDANTRDRDFGDVFVLSEIHAFDAEALRRSIYEVSDHRGRDVIPLRDAIATLATDRQRSWAAFRERAGLSALPERFADVVEGVREFIDPLLAADELHRWDPVERRWE
jgi:hypothetical protein